MPLLRFAAPLIAVLVLAVGWSSPAGAVDPKRVVTGSGIEAWLVEDHANPVLSVKFGFRGGASLDPADKPGVANLVAGTLNEGAGELPSQAFQEALAAKAIEMSFGAGHDDFSGTLKTLSEHRGRAFELLGLALTEPRFDPEPVARVTSQVRANLATQAEEPSYIANRALMRALFPDHPYGEPTDGTPASLDAIAPKDLHAYVERAFTRDRLVIGVAGDITPEELKPLLEKAFGRLPQSSQAAQPVPETEPEAAGETMVVDRDIRQAWVAFAHPGIARDDPDYYAASLVNYILGGGSFASRLMQTVRVEHGLAYSVYSYLHTLEHAPLIGGGLGTSNDRVAKALKLTRDTWRRLASEGPTEKELKDAKTYLKGSFATNLGSTGGIAAVLRAMQREKLGIDYMDERRELIDGVTAEDAKRVAGELLEADALTTVIVGEPTDVEPTRPAPEIGS
ncbi:zinc protease [Limimonas halophila]|uniref:Zinc protease n=1 Tax=Limimonas halophila TaxID=1082479 RepID=A0A1G7V851_9PROT|nr:pitrilysin family protein [Limimonas halophila]SDG55721.1 zinc protease [Limimonas halophila]